MGAQRRGIHPRNDAAARGGAYRCDRVRVCIPNSFGGESVEHRRTSVHVTIAAHHRCDVFKGNPNNIGSSWRSSSADVRRAKDREREEECGDRELVHVSTCLRRGIRGRLSRWRSGFAGCSCPQGALHHNRPGTRSFAHRARLNNAGRVKDNGNANTDVGPAFLVSI